MKDQVCVNCKHPVGVSDSGATRHKKTSQDGIFLTPYCTVQGCKCREPVIASESQQPSTEPVRPPEEKVAKEKRNQRRDPGKGTIEELARLLYAKLMVRQIKFFRSNNIKELLPSGTDKDRRREVITRMRQFGMIRDADNGVWYELIREKDPINTQDGPGTISIHINEPVEGIRTFVSSEVASLLEKKVSVLKFNRKGSTLDLWIDVGGEGNGS